MTSDGFIFLGFFFAGLAVNLTPCVYPMLTVTASLFKSRQSQNETLQYSFIKALTYFLGIAITYSALGYFAAAGGKILGSALQSTWVLLSVSLMMFALAFSMFGLFQLQVPPQLLNSLGGLRKANYLGLFISGMFVGVFAAPCIGPPVIALLAAVAKNGNPMFGLSAFFIFSLGLGLPYLLLGTFSGLIARLPKAGSWLIWVEHTFGVILFGFGFFYLLSALRSSLVHWVMPAALVVGGVYLGFFDKAGKEKYVFTRFRWVVGLIAFFVGSSFVSALVVSEKTKVVWQPYSDQKIAAAVSRHKPVVIDFYAEWCISCHELDHSIFSSPMVIKRLSQLTTLRVDATNRDDPLVQTMIDRYGLIGLPTVIFLDTHGHEIRKARAQGIFTLNEFLKSVDMVAKVTHITYKS